MITSCHIPSLIGWHWKSRMEYLLYQTNLSLSCHVICSLSCHGPDDITMRYTQWDLYNWRMESVLWLNGLIACSCFRRQWRGEVQSLIPHQNSGGDKKHVKQRAVIEQWPFSSSSLTSYVMLWEDCGGVQPMLMSALIKPWLDGLCKAWNINRVAQQGQSPTKITSNAKWNNMFYNWNQSHVKIYNNTSSPV